MAITSSKICSSDNMCPRVINAHLRLTGSLDKAAIANFSAVHDAFRHLTNLPFVQVDAHSHELGISLGAMKPNLS
jgi:hypothetical protein